MMEDKVVFEKSTVKSWGNAVRTKKGTTAEFPASQLEAEILSIETSENLDVELNDQESALNTLETEIESLDDKEPSTNKLALLLGTQDAVNKPYEITAEDLEGVTEIGERAFYWKKGLTSVLLPTTCTKIGGYAFYECQGLTTANAQNATHIGMYAFLGCGNLLWANILNATHIEESAFYNCLLLETVNAQNAMEIANYAFYNCKSLGTVNISNAIKIGTSAFANDEYITAINMQNVQQIGNFGFDYCSRLEVVTIPSSCTKIGTNSFRMAGRYSSSGKCTFRFEGTTPPTITTSTFTKDYIDKIIVPKGYGETYKTATNWVTFADYIVEAEE